MHGIDRSIPLFFTRVRGTRIPVTPQLVADVLHVPRIEFPDYPSYKRLRTVFRDELMSSFYERPTAWGECLFTPCRPFAKGPRFMNMVMTFVYILFLIITPSQSLMLDFCYLFLSILLQIFPLTSFCLSQMFIQIRRPVISSSFLPLSRGFYAIFPFLFPLPTIFPSCVPQITLLLNVVRPNFCCSRQIQQHPPFVLHHPSLLHLHPLLPLPMMCLLETSWRNCRAWMLAWIHSLRSYIR